MPRALIVLLLLTNLNSLLVIGLQDDWLDSETNLDFLYKSVCQRRPKYGKCRGHRDMWFFDVYQMKCSQFTYSNCGGNTNRFHTKLECEQFCAAHAKDWKKTNLFRN